MTAMTTPGPQYFAFVEALARDLSGDEFVVPSFPDAITNVRRAIQDENCTLKRVVALIGGEPALAARVLQIANSPLYYTGNAQITALPMAVQRLGFDTVRTVALTVAVEQLLRSASTPSVRTRLRQIWQHSVAVAATSYVLARRQTRLDADEAMLGGLMHDIGKYYVLSRIEEHPDLLADGEAVDHILDEWHTGVGRAILEHWGMAESIVHAAEAHEDLDGSEEGEEVTVTDVVAVANFLVNHSALSVSAEDQQRVPVLGRLGLGGADADDLLQAFADDIEALRSALGA